MVANGPINLLGTIGKIISVAAARINKSFYSALVITSFTNPCIGSFAASNIAKITPNAAASAM